MSGPGYVVFGHQRFFAGNADSCPAMAQEWRIPAGEPEWFPVRSLP